MSATLDPEILVAQTVLNDQYEGIADDGPVIQISRQKWNCKVKTCTKDARKIAVTIGKR